MKLNKTLLTAAALVVMIAAGCSDDFEESAPASVNIDLSGEITNMNPNCLVIDETNPGNRYSRVDSITQYGFGILYSLPDSLKDGNLKLVVSGRMRESESLTGYIAIAIHGKDSIHYWGSILSASHVKQLNNWVSFKDSIIINRTANPHSGVELKIFPFKQLGKGYYDVDSLTVKISRE